MRVLRLLEALGHRPQHPRRASEVSETMMTPHPEGAAARSRAAAERLINGYPALSLYYSLARLLLCEWSNRDR